MHPTERSRLTKNKQSPTGLGDPILFLMKQEDAQLDANWGGSPSPIHHWMEALLRLAAMCLLNLASLLGMRPSRHVRECHTDVSRRSRKAKAGATPQALPLQDCDLAIKETDLAARTSSQSIEALMLSSELGPRPRSHRVYPELVEGSKHEGGLTAASGNSMPTDADGIAGTIGMVGMVGIVGDAIAIARRRAPCPSV
jgi:hypothetical protein